MAGGETAGRLTRRELLGAAAAAGAMVGIESLAPAKILQQALAAPGAGTLKDIKHVVIFINENRSFDHYYGTYRGVRGFADPAVLRQADGSPVFAQKFAGAPFGAASPAYGGHLLPFHFDTTKNGECVNDIAHGWAPQHQAWNNGQMDRFLQVDIEPANNGPRDGINTMGYYTRADLPFYHALADAFTICDNYFGSVIGSTQPNRLYAMSATIDPDGTHGGPVIETDSPRVRAKKLGSYRWTTYPEQLQARGISWKIYGTPETLIGDNVLPYFRPYLRNPRLVAKALRPSFPGSFRADCKAGRLPQVSWVLAPFLDTEHPPGPVSFGELAAEILAALLSKPSLWASTAVLMTMDEGGGFFDHVPPPTAPPGTAGEYLTAPQLPASAGGIRGPIGLGFRVPLLVVSPFSRGGFVCSDTFDHTSLLRFLETRFGAEVPNLSAWRRGVTGDLTSAFNFIAPDASVPGLPKPKRKDPRVLRSTCVSNAPAFLKGPKFPTISGYPPPAPPQSMPAQEPGAPRRPSGIVP